jgi:allantoate deiminase
MPLRRDALCAAAEFILTAESLARATEGLVATVGQAAILPGASNVIPGEIRLSIDVRHPKDVARAKAMKTLQRAALSVARSRNVKSVWQLVQETPAVECDPALTRSLRDVVRRRQKTALELHSGAGHDAAIMAAITPVSMLFVRCKGGISHHPDESVAVKDVAAAIQVTSDFLQSLVSTL